MRSAPTEAERELWKFLRKKQIDGFRFRRQHIIHTFIVDFYCPTARLVIEGDGDIHLGQAAYDAERETLLRDLGYIVIRFKNNEIQEDLDHVIERIKIVLK
jgi:very-short-patch-repair endonuclease